MYKSLSDFVSLLEREGELVRVKAPVDPVLEIAEITDRVHKAGGAALLFENTGTEFPVLTNMFGTPRRLALALGDDLPAVRERTGRLLERAMSPADGLRGKLGKLPLLAEIAHFMPPKTRRRGACQQVVMWREGSSQADSSDGEGSGFGLDLLPILKCWPHDGGRFITLPLVTTTDPGTGARNVGMYRMQVQGGATTGMHWHVHKTGERHYRAWKAAYEGSTPPGGAACSASRLTLNACGERSETHHMPVTVCLGGDPAYTYAATAPMPEGMDEWMLAGFLRRRRVRLVRCLTNELWVPEDCDFVIEGYVDTAEPKFREGPFGDHTGFYSLDDLYPAFHVTAITHRRGAIYPATVVGVPPQEDFQIALATENIFVNPLRMVNPEVADLHMPAAGVAHNLALVSIAAAWPGQALKTAAAMWGAGQMMFNKVLVLLPESVALHGGEDGAVEGASWVSEVARRLRDACVSEDILLGRGVLDALDHATATPGVGGKIALDLTAARPPKQPWCGGGVEQNGHAEPREQRDVACSAPRLTLGTCGSLGSPTSTLLAEWGALIIYGAAGEMGEVGLPELRDVNFVVLADAAAAGLTNEELLWHVLANTDPVRDVVVRNAAHTQSDAFLLIDGRTKSPQLIGLKNSTLHTPATAGAAAKLPAALRLPPVLPHRVPNVVVSSAATIALVDSRWTEYGLGTLITSPSLHYAPLVYSDKAEV